jgi:hypothetical protein
MSYVPGTPPSATSDVVINSTVGANISDSTDGSLGRWDAAAAADAAVFIGAGEANDYNYAAINLQTDVNGVLTFEFSQDGTNWSQYPVTNFTIVSGINEVHGAWKGTRYIRPKFTRDAITATNTVQTYFRMQVMYSYDPIILSAPLNQSIGSDSDASIVKAISTGQSPIGNYVAEKADGVGVETIVNLGGTTMNDAGGIDAVDTSVTLTDSTGFASPAGTIRIEDEQITYTGNAANVLSGLTRGANGTTATTHADAVQVGEVWDGGILSTEGYTQVQTEVLTDVTGTAFFDFYSDAAGTDKIRALAVPATAALGYQFFAAPVFGQSVRYRFSNNDTSNQTDFHFMTKALTKSISGQLLTMNAFISPSMVANLGRNVVVGQDPQGTFRNTTVDYLGNLEVAIADPVTGFGDLRTAELTPVVQLQFPYNINGDILNTTLANGGTVTAANSMAVLQSSTATNGSAVMESIRQIKYRSGLGALARFTTLYTTGVAGATQIAGVGDEEDGFFFGYNGTSFGIMVRNDSVDTWTAQTAWSEDVMDGSGRSKMILDQTKLNVFAIEYQWLGAGEIGFRIEDPVSGKFVTVHRIKYANANIVPSTLNPSFPLHMDVTKTSGATNITMKAASMSGFVEGKSLVTGPLNGFTGNVTTQAELALFSLQNVSTYEGVKNRVSAFITTLAVANDTNGLATYRVYLNATLAGTPTWVNVNGTDSVIQSDIVQTYASGGKVIYLATVGKDSGQLFELPEEKYSLRPGDVITITAETVGNANPMAVSINWQEDF